MSLPLNEYLDELSDLDRPLSTSKLANLSDLTPEEVRTLQAEWPNIDIERRREIVGWLTDILEDNLELDFDNVFRICLADDDSEIRAEAIEGLWECEDRSLISPFINFLNQDEDVAVRTAAAVALGKFVFLAEMGNLPPDNIERLVETLLNAFNDNSEQMEVRCKVLEAISTLSKPEVEELIRRAYKSENLDLKASAIYAMGRNCNPGWLPLLLKELLSPHAKLRFEAVRACAELESEEAVPRLIQLLSDDDSEIQISAIEALGHIGGEEAKRALNECLDDEDDSIRYAAEDALDEIGFWDDPADF